MLNIVVCGTPGTGKTSLIERLKPQLPSFNFINVGKFAIDNGCVTEFDETLDTHVIDEDKLIEKLRPILEENEHNLIECIHADLIPSDLVDQVYVCRTDNTILFDRLKARNYSDSKIANNVQAEIFQTIYDEALEAFGHGTVTQLTSDKESDLDKNSNKVLRLIRLILE